MRARARFGLVLALLAGGAHAHRPSDAFLTLQVDGAAAVGQWEIALRDLEVLAPVDADGDRRMTWGELRQARPALARALGPALSVAADGAACAVDVTDLLLHDRLDGPYAWFALAVRCPAAPARLELRYALLHDVDPTHRGILALDAGATSHTAVLSPAHDAVTFVLAQPSWRRQFGNYFREGVRHIWIGADHALFLLALLLPSVLVRQADGWRAAARLGPVIAEVVKVVTAFTLAHSVTLALAALDVVRLPGALIESAIAASVALAALNNLWPLVTRARWAVAALFGLVHGFGFASVLAELGLPDGSRALSLTAFNLGVELGQLAIVALALPPAFAMRETAGYRHGLVAGSVACVAFGVLWLAQRSGLLES